MTIKAIARLRVHADANTDAAIKVLLARVKAVAGISWIKKARKGEDYGYVVLTNKGGGKVMIMKQILVANKFKVHMDKSTIGIFHKVVVMEDAVYAVVVMLIAGIPDEVKIRVTKVSKKT